MNSSSEGSQQQSKLFAKSGPKTKENRRTKQARLQEKGQLQSQSKFVPVDTTTDEENGSSRGSKIQTQTKATKPFQYTSQLPDSINVVIPMHQSEGTLLHNPTLTSEAFASAISVQEDGKNNDEPLINQYEQVMQLMHLEMTKLIEQNKQLKDEMQNQPPDQSLQAQDQNNQQDQLAAMQLQFEMQNILREREDLVESLSVRESTINSLRLENQQLMSRIMNIEVQNDQQRVFQAENSNMASVEVANLRAKNVFLEDRLRQLEEQVRSSEQKLFSADKHQKGLQRETKSLEQMIYQSKQETARVHQRREAAEQLIMELKQRLCDVYVDMRGFQNQIDTQNISITKLTNAKQNTERLLRQANDEIDELNGQLNENESIKLGQFAQLEKKDRNLNSLKGMCKKLIGFVQAHHDVYGDVNSAGFDRLMGEIDDSVDLEFELPESKFDHIFKPSRHMKFLVDVDEPVKNAMGQTGGTMPNYYQMIEELQLHVSSVISQAAAQKQQMRAPMNSVQQFPDVRNPEQTQQWQLSNVSADDFRRAEAQDFNMSFNRQQERDFDHQQVSRGEKSRRQASKESIHAEPQGVVWPSVNENTAIQWPTAKQQESPSAIQWPTAKQPEKQKVYDDDRPLPTLAKQAALAEEKKVAPARRQEPVNEPVNEKKEPAKPASRSTTPKAQQRRGPNVEAMKNTLASLKEEKSTLDDKLKRNRNDADTQFELALVVKNIQTLTEKIAKAQ